MSLRQRIAFVLTGAAAASLMLVAGASAATIRVTTTADTFDAGSGDGLCSVREALESATTDTNKGGCGSQGSFTLFDDVVEIPAGHYVLTRAEAGEINDNASGSLGIEENTEGATLRGVGPGTAILDGNGDKRIFQHGVLGTTRIGFENLLIQNGKSTSGGLISAGNTAVDIHNSTLRGGVASDEGGALHTFGNVDISNSTFTGNSAADAGGALYLEGNVGGTIANVTISGNTANADGVGNEGGGGLVKSPGDDVALSNSIVAGNAGSGSAADCAASAIVSAGNNVLGTQVGCDAPGDQVGVTDARLAALADNGGPAPTMALLGDSPALNRGTGCLATDQRGVERFVGGVCDVGAYELVTCEGQAATRVGTAGDDQVTGTEGNDVFLLLGGNDTATGLGGNDLACGGDGNDTFDGGAGDDRFLGEGGNDTMVGADGNDVGVLGDGDDSQNGGAGNDTLDGGNGNDSQDGGAGNDKADLGEGNDSAKGGAGKDRLSGKAGKDTLKGGAGKDRLNGGAGKDKLKGQGGKDKCIGSGGKDTGKSCEKESSIP